MKTPKKEWNMTQTYEDDVFSVFGDKDAINPIFKYLNNKSSSLIVADLGCGHGNFLPFLAERFRRVYAVDFASPLLKQAQERNTSFNNIEYKQLDLKKLKELYNTSDIIVSVNSLFPEKIKDIDVILGEFRKCLKNEGEIVAILPSAESLMHSFLLSHQKLLDKGMSEEKARTETFDEFNIQKCDALGLHAYNKGEVPQKHYFETELKSRFARNGFEVTTIEKVEYSWNYCKNNNAGYHPKEPRLWDWFIVAKKVNK